MVHILKPLEKLRRMEGYSNGLHVTYGGGATSESTGLSYYLRIENAERLCFDRRVFIYLYACY